jgi:rhodanese-related sulfurtransferase
LHSKGVNLSAAIQKGVTSLDTLTSQNERADLYTLRPDSELSACHAPPPVGTLHIATHCALPDNLSAEHIATSTRCCHLPELSSGRRTAHSVPVVCYSGVRSR